ncbi:MAG: hypothetical protein ABI718_14000 [Acidobacteriota bacterium]
MRKAALIFSALAFGTYLAARKTEKRFRSAPGRLATTFSGKYRARHELLQAGSDLAWKAGLASLLLTLVPVKRHGR